MERGEIAPHAADQLNRPKKKQHAASDEVRTYGDRRQRRTGVVQPGQGLVPPIAGSPKCHTAEKGNDVDGEDGSAHPARRHE